MRGSVAFNNKDLILNFRRNVIVYLQSKGMSVSWDFSEPAMRGGGFGGTWDSIFILGNIRKRIVFEEDSSGGCAIIVDGDSFAYVNSCGSFDASVVKRFWVALGVKL